MGWSHADHFAKSTGSGPAYMDNDVPFTCAVCGLPGRGLRSRRHHEGACEQIAKRRVVERAARKAAAKRRKPC
jgi:hypothetical protein